MSAGALRDLLGTRCLTEAAASSGLGRPLRSLLGTGEEHLVRTPFSLAKGLPSWPPSRYPFLLKAGENMSYTPCCIYSTYRNRRTPKRRVPGTRKQNILARFVPGTRKKHSVPLKLGGLVFGPAEGLREFAYRVRVCFFSWGGTRKTNRVPGTRKTIPYPSNWGCRTFNFPKFWACEISRTWYVCSGM